MLAGPHWDGLAWFRVVHTRQMPAAGRVRCCSSRLMKTGADGTTVLLGVEAVGEILAGGERGGNGRADPVVWLSADGLAWTPVGFAGTTRPQVSQLLAHGDQLVVATVGASGPGVAVLTNWAELLAQL